MTGFERNARYSYDEKLAYLKQLGYKYPNLQTMSFEGYDVISYSKLGKGFTVMIYKNGALIKMRNKGWRDNINTYIKAYIHQELTAAPTVEAKVLKSYNPCSESPDKTYHAIEIVYEDTNKDIPYLKAGDTFKMTVVK